MKPGTGTGVAHRPRWGIRLLAAAAAACAAVAAIVSHVPGGGTAGANASAAPAPVTLADALSVSRPLGPVAPRTTIRVGLALRGRHAAELDRLLREGHPVPAAMLATRYGPDPVAVRRVLAHLHRAGLSASWTPGERLAFAHGTAAAVSRLFHVSLARYAMPQGRRFYAPLPRRPAVPAALRPVVTAVVGLDDFALVQSFGHLSLEAIRPGGLTPSDILSFYDITPLRDHGLTGSGETVVMPELSSPAELPQLRQDLATYAAKFHLPPFQLTERHGPGWQPSSLRESRSIQALGETALDLEIVHAVAPGAKLVIYEVPRAIGTETVRAELAMVNQNPGAIISDSTGFCESIVPSAAAARLLAQPWARAEALNMTHFVASGDSGAYSCTEQKAAAVEFTPGTCTATSVGGTTVFQSSKGGYYRETAWGNPISESGGGGGVSRIFRRPSWQQGAGVQEAASNGGCQVPDVAGAADGNTGWQIRVYGKWQEIGGTSAAAPLWSGITALIDQELRAKGLHPVGFASPGIYWIGQHQSQFDPKPFYDITAGNNLLYDAGPGWDFATGWGSPDAVGLLAAWEAYRSTVGR